VDSLAKPLGNRWHFHSPEEGLARVLGEGVSTHVFFGTNVMFSFVQVHPNTTSVVHSHQEEQWGYLLEGECVRIQGNEEVNVKAGEFWYTPSNVPHGIRTGQSGARILDVFSPPRRPYAEPGSGLAALEINR
jgi:quercetin dioxygenase-like cupin family protein